MAIIIGPQKVGTGAAYPLTSYDSGTTPHVFSGTETLTAKLWDPVEGVVYAQPAVAFTNAAAGLLTVTVSAANTLAVPRADRYALTVTYTAGSSDPAVAVDATIILAPAVGSAPPQPALISVDRASQALPNATSDELLWVPAMVAAASRIIEKYCRRYFLAQNYDETYDGNGFGSLILNNFPVNRIDRVSTTPTQVVSISNTDTNNVQRASVRMDTGTDLFDFQDITPLATGIRLQATRNGVVDTPTVLALSAYPTLDTLAAAINGLGGGWSCIIKGGYEKRPTADLRAPQGSMDAAQSRKAQLTYYAIDLSNFDFNPSTGDLRFGSQDTYGPLEGFGPYFFVDPDPFVLRGPMAIRVLYNAGFDVVPEDVQWACTLAVQKFMDEARTSQIYEHEKLGDYEYYMRKHASGQVGLPEGATQILNLYRDFRG